MGSLSGYSLWTFLIFLVISIFIYKRIILWTKKNSEESPFSTSKNRLSIIAIHVGLLGFLAVTSIWLKVIDSIVKIIGFFFDINIESDSSSDIYALIAYLILCLFIISIGVLDYLKLKNKENFTTISDFDELGKKKSPPPPIPPKDPVFPNRIEELFKLKFENLHLEHIKSSQILYGVYKEGYATHFFIIHYSFYKKDALYGIRDIEKVNGTLENILNGNEFFGGERALQNRSIINKKYFIIERGKFETFHEDLICLTEEEFVLKDLIDFSQYLNQISYDFENSKLRFSENKKLTLEETFLAPSFNNGEKSIDEIYEWIKDESNPYKHLAILGDNGTGKTSLLKYLSYSIAHKILLKKEIIRYPVFISLTNNSPVHGGINKILSEFIETSELNTSLEAFLKLIYRGKIIFFLDGFDEMGFIGTYDQRFQQLDTIWQLATEGNKIIISGRPSYFTSEFEEALFLNYKKNKLPTGGPYCEKWTIDYFSDEKIKESIRIAYGENEISEAYIDYIFTNKSLKDLCRRPSMLHMLREMLPQLSDYQKEEAKNDNNLMGQYVDYWVDYQLKKAIPSVWEKSDKRKKLKFIDFVRDLFTDIAGDNYKFGEGNISFTYHQLKNIVQKKIGDKNLNISNQEEIEGLEAELLTGFFIERVGNNYKFTHKSFYEYFVSLKIINLISVQRIEEKLISEEKWTNEIVDFVYTNLEGKSQQNEIVFEDIKTKPTLLKILNEHPVINITNLLFNISTKKFSPWFGEIIMLTRLAIIIFIFFDIFDKKSIFRFTTLSGIDLKLDKFLEFSVKGLFNFISWIIPKMVDFLVLISPVLIIGLFIWLSLVILKKIASIYTIIKFITGKKLFHYLTNTDFSISRFIKHLARIKKKTKLYLIKFLNINIRNWEFANIPFHIFFPLAFSIFFIAYERFFFLHKLQRGLDNYEYSQIKLYWNIIQNFNYEVIFYFIFPFMFLNSIDKYYSTKRKTISKTETSSIVILYTLILLCISYTVILNGYTLHLILSIFLFLLSYLKQFNSLSSKSGLSTIIIFATFYLGFKWIVGFEHNHFPLYKMVNLCINASGNLFIIYLLLSVIQRILRSIINTIKLKNHKISNFVEKAHFIDMQKNGIGNNSIKFLHFLDKIRSEKTNIYRSNVNIAKSLVLHQNSIIDSTIRVNWHEIKTQELEISTSKLKCKEFESLDCEIEYSEFNAKGYISYSDSSLRETLVYGRKINFSNSTIRSNTITCGNVYSKDSSIIQSKLCGVVRLPNLVRRLRFYINAFNSNPEPEEGKSYTFEVLEKSNHLVSPFTNNIYLIKCQLSNLTVKGQFNSLFFSNCQFEDFNLDEAKVMFPNNPKASFLYYFKYKSYPFKLYLVDLQKENIDQNSLDSFKNFISQNDLIYEKNVICDEWLKEELGI